MCMYNIHCTLYMQLRMATIELFATSRMHSISIDKAKHKVYVYIYKCVCTLYIVHTTPNTTGTRFVNLNCCGKHWLNTITKCRCAQWQFIYIYIYINIYSANAAGIKNSITTIIAINDQLSAIHTLLW